jgi:hypothetical protein
VWRLRKILPLVFLMLGCGPAIHADCRGTADLNELERRDFINASYGNASAWEVQALVSNGCAREVLNRLKRLGATVLFVDEKVGYIFASVPRRAVLAVLDVPGISFASAVGGGWNRGRSSATPPALNGAFGFSIAFPNVAQEVVEDGPYFPAGEAGLPSLWALHPRADGRGVRVAVIDSGFDMLHPALRFARSSTGKLVPKIADIVPPLDSEDELLDANWVEFGVSFRVAREGFTQAGRRWTAPGPGTYRFGMYSRVVHLPQATGAAIEVHLTAGVLWNEMLGRIWVDTDGDHDFRDGKGVRDYAVNHELLFFGSKTVLGDNRIPFGVKIDGKRKRAFFSISGSSHGTDIAGPLAANRLSGGLFNGASPSAQLIDVPIPLTDGVPLLVSVLKAFQRKDADIVNRSGYLAGQDIGNEFDRERGDFERRVVERAVAVYDKPIVCSCGIKGGLYVNDYQSVEMLRRNRQIPPPLLEAMNSDVWFTPDGLVNTVVGPSTSLLATSRYFPFHLPGARVLNPLMLSSPAPAGYNIGANNSPTISLVSGVLADLIGEARRQRVRFDATRLTQAVLSGATWVDGFPASEQGFGLINGAGAWLQLKAMARADDPENSALTFFTVYAPQRGALQEANGFHMDLDAAGETFDAEIWIARGGGYAGRRLYALALRANDGAFRLTDRVLELKRGEPVRVRFSVQANPGLHVAFLQVRDLHANVVIKEVPLSVRAPEIPEVIAPGVEKYRSSLNPRRRKKIYIHVGREAQAVRYTMDVPYAGPNGKVSIRAMPGFRWGVKGHALIPTEAPLGAPMNPSHHVGPMQKFTSLVDNVEGLATISWDNRGEPEYETPYDPPAPDVAIEATLTVSSYAVAFSRTDGGVLTITNRLAAIRGNVELYNAKLRTSEESGEGSHATALIRRMLTGHPVEWRIKISAKGLAQSNGDIFLLHCAQTDGDCSVVAQKPTDGTSLVVRNPEPGEWRIVARVRDTVSRSLSYQVQEAYLDPIVTDEGGSATHSSGESWSLALSLEQREAKYAAFRLACYCGEGTDTHRIAMTSFDPNLP